MNLITPFEVLKYSPAGFNYPTRSFCILIPQIEQAFRRECLGDALFDFLISKMNEYPDNVSEWDVSLNYVAGNIVIRNQCTFVALTENLGVDPIKTNPNEDDTWVQFSRFNHDGANELWSMYLRQILASKVYVATVTSATYQTGAGGIVVNQGDTTGARAANKTELLAIINEQNDFQRMTVENMLKWLSDNATEKGLPSVSCSTGCETRTNRSRRFAFRT